MTDHSIKIARATRLAKVGRFSGTCSAMLEHVPPELADRLTGRDLALVLDALHACASRSKRLAEQDAVREGVVWDDRAGRLREIAA